MKFNQIAGPYCIGTTVGWLSHQILKQKPLKTAQIQQAQYEKATYILLIVFLCFQAVSDPVHPVHGDSHHCRACRGPARHRHIKSSFIQSQ